MKKTVLLLAVCLMLGLCACGLRGQSVARNAVEPVHFSAPAVRQDAAPAEEPRVTLPQGASLLTEQELAYYRRGKNAHVHAAPKGATQAQYAKATGLETLFGALYLAGERERASALFLAVVEPC